MDYKQAIADLKRIDGTADSVSALENELERLTSKNYELIGENRRATGKVASLQTSIDAIVEATGADGEDVTAKFTAATEKVKSLATQLSEANTRASAAETKSTEAETKLTGLERKATIATAAAKTGAVAGVLEKLLGDRVSELTIDGDTVKLGDKPLREFVEAEADLKAFIPALFPAQQAGTGIQLPSAPPNGQAPTPANPVDAYLNKTYTVPAIAPVQP